MSDCSLGVSVFLIYFIFIHSYFFVSLVISSYSILLKDIKRKVVLMSEHFQIFMYNHLSQLQSRYIILSWIEHAHEGWCPCCLLVFWRIRFLILSKFIILSILLRCSLIPLCALYVCLLSLVCTVVSTSVLRVVSVSPCLHAEIMLLHERHHALYKSHVYYFYCCVLIDVTLVSLFSWFGWQYECAQIFNTRESDFKCQSKWLQTEN